MNSPSKGFAALELLIALPVLLLLLVAVIEVSRMMLELNTLNKSVRIGARYASTQTNAAGCGPVNNRIEDIKKVVVFGSVNGTSAQLRNWQVSDVVINCTDNQYVSIVASYTFLPTFASSLPISNRSLSVPMTSSSVMRIF
ncbi:hypothetical protein BCU68_06060 [Vibrio sp. 10N.286.49.B3]|uniref:TadE/TadG family type IV pilus assembly protein n=1 Tax=Vibrio sp. 10N.286.49.B3 TaxID=1880855 RepID=UPI000C82C4A6|nr:TadE/TadG family type IV pilus assembly protein [Vibrio sp. 10N.286.49.B3]PMH41241.1 hypothetical protein BCU68_06060 [Vibrio sp. 10N.286.49.B3]